MSISRPAGADGRAAAAIAETEAACVDLEREGEREVDTLRLAFPEHDSPLCALLPSVFVGF